MLPVHALVPPVRPWRVGTEDRQGRHASAWLVQARHDRAVPAVLRFISFSQVSFQYLVPFIHVWPL